MGRCRFERLTTILDVREISAALRYYTENLGFDIAFRYVNDPENYAGVRRDAVFIDMQWQDEDEFRRGAAGNLRVRIEVDDPDALLAEYRAKNVIGEEVVVRETEWGTREFGFRDPDGNTLIFYRNG